MPTAVSTKVAIIFSLNPPRRDHRPRRRARPLDHAAQSRIGMDEAVIGHDREVQPAGRPAQQQVARRVARASDEAAQHRRRDRRLARRQRVARRDLPAITARLQREGRDADAIHAQRRIAPMRAEARPDGRPRRRDDTLRARHPPG
ncbi:hypothetical protein [Sphingomonas sp. CL5.1]|uniref:hypothetical protein n=1 Tax=Sphingomonas sp. CL5.1 TaxID=2653203 RepID=UPI0015839FCC